MGPTYKILDSTEFQGVDYEKQLFALDVLNGLCSSLKSLPCKYLYDDAGSLIFQEIMKLEDYYLTGCELEIFEQQCPKLLPLFAGKPFNVIELGSGDGFKTIHLLQTLVNAQFDFQYVPIDISEQAMEALSQALRQKAPTVTMSGLVGEYFDGLKWLNGRNKRQNFVLFLGSNLGNYNNEQATQFLQSLWYTLNEGDYLLIGLDLVKDITIMEQAYQDKPGVTARFNLNLLSRINRELGGEFSLDHFEFHSKYNFVSRAIDSFLVSRKAQRVLIRELERHFEFEESEVIHTESSHKYTRRQIAQLAKDCGYQVETELFDSKGYFVDSVWKVRKANA
jgi:L-histidine Nalpha-methyltransferase